MTINQALKEKNRLAGKLKVLDQRIQNNVKWIKSNKPAYDFGHLLSERLNVMQNLIDLKTAISKATTPIAGSIILLAELKSQLLMYRSLDVREGLILDRYSNTTGIEYQSAIDQKGLDYMIDGIEVKISAVQDELDKFNASTEI